MSVRQLLATTVFVSLAGAAWAVADEVRYYQQDGTTFRETRRVVQRPVSETHLQQSTRTVYRQERSTEIRKTTRTWWTPVTEYSCEWHWAGRWNPFVQPYLTTRMVPQTKWEQRVEETETPVACCRLVPESQTVQVPVTTRRMVSEEVISRVAVAGRAAGQLQPVPQTPTLARREQIGGVARLDDKDPPRHGVSTAWRAATTR